MTCIHCWKIGTRSGILVRKIGLGSGYVFEALMASRLQPKMGQVHRSCSLGPS